MTGAGYCSTSCLCFQNTGFPDIFRSHFFHITIITTDNHYVIPVFPDIGSPGGAVQEMVLVEQ